MFYRFLISSCTLKSCILKFEGPFIQIYIEHWIDHVRVVPVRVAFLFQNVIFDLLFRLSSLVRYLVFFGPFLFFCRKQRILKLAPNNRIIFKNLFAGQVCVQGKKLVLLKRNLDLTQGLEMDILLSLSIKNVLNYGETT